MIRNYKAMISFLLISSQTVNIMYIHVKQVLYRFHSVFQSTQLYSHRCTVASHHYMLLHSDKAKTHIHLCSLSIDIISFTYTC